MGTLIGVCLGLKNISSDPFWIGFWSTDLLLEERRLATLVQ